jgi:hypothetical protein
VVGLSVIAALAILLAKSMGYLLLFALIPLDASIAPAAPFPCAYRKATEHRKMAEPNEVAVLKRAKAAAEQDGLTWEFNFGSPGASGIPRRGQHFLSENRRQEYLERARAELRKEAGT